MQQQLGRAGGAGAGAAFSGVAGGAGAGNSFVLLLWHALERYARVARHLAGLPPPLRRRPAGSQVRPGPRAILCAGLRCSELLLVAGLPAPAPGTRGGPGGARRTSSLPEPSLHPSPLTPAAAAEQPELSCLTAPHLPLPLPLPLPPAEAAAAGAARGVLYGVVRLAAQAATGGARSGPTGRGHQPPARQAAAPALAPVAGQRCARRSRGVGGRRGGAGLAAGRGGRAAALVQGLERGGWAAAPVPLPACLPACLPAR
jgi:hypothetical protein